jgi:predicted TIM-barrel fold metal-dependent hydrolase
MAANQRGREWYDRAAEPIIEPDRPIIDTHFHFFTGFGHDYLAEQLLEDVGDGHNIVGMVHVEANADFFKSGGAPGEMRFAAEQGGRMRAMQAGRARICDPVAGIVGYADLRAPDLREQLDALTIAAEGRLRGIRNSSAWDAAPDVRNGHTNPPQGLLADPAFRAGLRQLAELGLVFDSYAYHPQIREQVALARAVPEAVIICDHLGGLIGVGPYKGRVEEAFDVWKADLAALAACPNVVLKLGGMAMSVSGWNWHKRDSALRSEEYASHHARWFHAAIEMFGPDRCMYESNFPVDGVSISYNNLWNAFKIISDVYNDQEKDRLFFNTASRVYRLGY